LKTNICIIFIFVILQWVSVFTYANEKMPPKISVEGVLAVRIIPLKQPIANARVEFQVKIKNVSTKAINLPWPKFINQFMSTESTTQGEGVLSIKHSGGALGHGRYPGGDLKPGDELTVKLWHVFPGGGRYMFKCILDTTVLKGYNMWNVWEGRAESKSITIEITK